MQIQNKKEITLSPTTGTPVIVRRGNIAAWNTVGNKTFNKTEADSGLYYQIGSSLKIESSGKPMRLRASFEFSAGNGSTQQQAFVTIFVGIKRVDVAGDYLVNTFESGQGWVIKVYNNGNIADYKGISSSKTINVVDRNPTVHGETYEYKLVGYMVAYEGSTDSTIVTGSVTIRNFEIEEVQ